jgi:hypothetical protein
MMCILLGLLAEMITRTFYESQGKAIYNIRSMRNLPDHTGTAESRSDRTAEQGQYRVSR